MNRKGKMIRISDEAYEKLKLSNQPMSAQIDELLNLESISGNRKKQREFKGYKEYREAMIYCVISGFFQGKASVPRASIIAGLMNFTPFERTMIKYYDHETHTAYGRKTLNDAIDNSLRKLCTNNWLLKTNSGYSLGGRKMNQQERFKECKKLLKKDYEYTFKSSMNAQQEEWSTVQKYRADRRRIDMQISTNTFKNRE
tara:strand:- start:108 stop:704 length:597 start_codon:yes stop_codon:yes gene_type:complete